MTEEVVLFAAFAVSALQATDKQERHAHRDKNGEQVFVCDEPMN
jgi:hypothetical protein